MITSSGNARVKEVCALIKKPKERKAQGLFIVEGLKMFLELPKDHLEKVFLSETFLSQTRQQGLETEAFLDSVRAETVTDDVMSYMSDTQTPQGILAVARQFNYRLDEILAVEDEKPVHLLILETIQDPGNLGTIIRAGEGAGITGIVMNTSTADIYSPKVIRSTMGSIYRVPFVYTDSLESAISRIKQTKISLFAAHLKGARNYDEEDFSGNTGFLIGNEANGLSEPIAALADHYVRIPMAGQVESLNAAVAASVLMFEASRQRRTKNE